MLTSAREDELRSVKYFRSPNDGRMQVRINGETWSRSTPGPMKWSFPEIISYTSQSETLNIGDVFGSGTVNNGCGFEIDRWIAPGDTVELEAEGIGVLRNRVGRPDDGPAVNWRRPERWKPPKAHEQRGRQW